MDDELTSGAIYEEPEELETIQFEDSNSGVDQEITSEYTLLTAEDLPLLEYASIGMISCGTACLVSIGVGVLLGILRKA